MEAIQEVMADPRHPEHDELKVWHADDVSSSSPSRVRSSRRHRHPSSCGRSPR
jgi:hypothetical protein